MRRKRTHVYAAVCAVLGVALSASQAEAQIRWLTGSSPQMIVSAPEAAQSIATMAAADDARHIVVEFGEAITPSDRQYLEGRGLKLLGYLGDNAYFAVVSGRRLDVAGLARFDKLTGARAIEPNWKLHPLLVTDEAPQWALLNPGKPDEPMIPVYVLFHPDVPLANRAVSVAYRHDALVRSRIETINGLVLEIPFRNVAALAQEDTVQYIEPALPRWGEVNDSIRQNVGADIVQAPPYSLDGAGVMVLVYDGGKARATHDDFSGDLGSRVTIGPSDTSSMSDHATHVSCTIGGNGTASAGLYRGMAPACSLLSYGFEQEGGLQEGFLYTDPGDLEADYGEAISMFSAVISNNSIGTNTAPNGFPCEWEGNYGVTSALIDDVVRGVLGEPIRIVWANGNERSSGRCGTTYHTTAPPACAKNHITVGAMNSNDDSVTYFTSWGPTDDGRLKPDLSAPGCQSDGDGTVTSCSSSSDTAYTGKCGTSMACPTAAGVTALVLQDFRNQFPGEPDPLPSTMKALLVQNVEDLENPGPDYKTGYGIIRAQPTVDFMRMGYFLEGEVGQDESYLFLVYAETGDPELKITLTWDDPPGTPNVYPNLVNDLDLIVTSPSSVRHYPWTLDPENPSADAVQTVEDHANNIEQVYVLDPEPGAWQVEVFGYAVPQGPQLFSACASPLLVNCSSQGIIRLGKARYSCNDAEVEIKVVDCDLNTDDQTVETVDVVIESDSDDADQGDPPVIVTLTETAAETADFRGSVPLTTTTPGDPSSLYIQPSDEIRGIYIDADDG
ncbi:MAG: S8 family serine peptidase [Phycisphaerales bacterium]|nr:MAG: S8 family serine peptidase [Phycisphaerales bacterium]